MGAETGISWCDATWNTVGGCTIHSSGCGSCYAMKLAGTRLKHHPLYANTTSPSKTGPVFNGNLTALPDGHPGWTWPLRWRGSKAPKAGGARSLIFVADMADLYHEDRSVEDIYQTLAVAAVDLRHIHLHLTKRADVMSEIIGDSGTAAAVAGAVQRDYAAWPGAQLRASELDAGQWPPKNLWLGASIERPAELHRLTDLRDTPAALRFLSLEPLIEDLGPLDLTGIGWCICGGESGSDPRPMELDWVRRIRDDCGAAGVPFHFKQHGDHPSLKGEVDHMLDGERWAQFPVSP